MTSGRKSPLPARQADIRPSFRPDIEGLRGIAVLLVVLFHAKIPGFSGGYVGVDVFFVLSGYLITWLMILEYEKRGKISLVAFYARRAGRLLPALAALLTVVLLAGFFLYGPDEIARLSKTTLAAIFYGSNIYFIVDASDYMAPAAETNALLHTWSLAVEEQFYFLWPLVTISGLALTRFLGQYSRGLILSWLFFLLAAASFLLCLFLMAEWRILAFYSSPTRAWEFAAGALALLVSRRGAQEDGDGGDISATRTSAWLGWAGLLVLLAVGASYTHRTTFPGWAAVPPVIATCLLLRAGASSQLGALQQLLSSKPLRILGRLSYSWYLWHWPVLVFAGEIAGELTLLHRVAALALSLLLAELSFRLVETPGRRIRMFGEQPIARLQAAAALSVGVAVGCGVVLTYAQKQLNHPRVARIIAAKERMPLIYDTDCRPSFESEAVVHCLTGDPQGARTVVLFGDSHAAQWGPALERIAEARGWRLYQFVKSACPSLSLEAFWYDQLKRNYNECPRWRESAFAAIQKLSPELVISSNSYGYDAAGIEEDQWYRAAERSFARLQATADHTLHLSGTPRPVFSAPTCALRAWGQTEKCTFSAKRSEIHDRYFEAERRAAGRFSNVATLETYSWFCPEAPCTTALGDVFLYRDGHHLTVDAVLLVRERLEKTIADM